MTCRELVDFLMEYLEDELPGDSRRVFEAHLGECPPCQAYLDTYKEAIRRRLFIHGGRDLGLQIRKTLHRIQVDVQR